MKVQNNNNNKTLVNKLIDMKSCELNVEEFKIADLKKLNEIQENPERQLNKLRNKINKQKEYFTKETETIKKNQTNFAAEKLSK